MKRSNFQTTTSSNPQGTISVTSTNWDAQVELLDYLRFALCWLKLIHRPHCHLLEPLEWTWRPAWMVKGLAEEAPWWGKLLWISEYTYDDGSTNPAWVYWNPLHWFLPWRGDCGHCGVQDCLNFNDC